MLSRLITILLIVFLAGCIHLPCKKEPSPPLQLGYGFICEDKDGKPIKKTIVYKGKAEEYEVCFITKEDKQTLETYLIFWCK